MLYRNVTLWSRAVGLEEYVLVYGQDFQHAYIKRHGLRQTSGPRQLLCTLIISCSYAPENMTTAELTALVVSLAGRMQSPLT